MSTGCTSVLPGTVGSIHFRFIFDSASVPNFSFNSAMPAISLAVVGVSVFGLGRNLLAQIGDIKQPSHMPAATALCTSDMAFFRFAPFLERAVDGAVALGIGRGEALHMAAHTMAGTAELALSGKNPAVSREKKKSPLAGDQRRANLAVLAVADADVRGSCRSSPTGHRLGQYAVCSCCTVRGPPMAPSTAQYTTIDLPPIVAVHIPCVLLYIYLPYIH